MSTERDQMLRGLPYDASDPALAADRLRARELVRLFNDAAPADEHTRSKALAALLGHCGARVRIEPPFRCDYGTQLSIGDDVYINFGCIVLDCASVRIGDRALLGPNVQILAATHPLDVGERRRGRELARPVSIAEDVWLGAGVIVCPGVTIGAASVIGAGSVVVSDVPADVLAVGNPCRVLRRLAHDL